MLIKSTIKFIFASNIVMLLSEIETGRLAEIVAIEDHEISGRLADMGFIEGEQVEVLFKSPFNDPIAVQIHQSKISLRKSEAALIQIRPV